MRRAWLALVVVLAGCGGSTGELPEAVEAFERRLEKRQGVLHVVTDQVRFLSEDFMPDLPPGGWRDEIWLDLGGARVRGRAAHIVTVDPDPSINTRLYVARDDGDLLRLIHRRERRGRLRTIVQDYAVFEVTDQRELNLAALVGLE